MLPEPISITTAVLSIAGSACKISKDTYDLIQGIRGAPTHITRLSKDIQGLSGVLGTLQHLLAGEAKKTVIGELVDKLIVDLEDLLRNCVEVFKDIQKILAPFKSDSSTHTAWKGFRWEIFKKNDVTGLQTTLSSYKLSLNIACQALLVSTTSSTHDIVQQIQKDVQQLKCQADSREIEPSPGQRLNESNDNDDPMNDHEQWPKADRLSTASSDLSIRRFLIEAETLVSSLSGDSCPLSVTVSESLGLDEDPENDFSGDDNTANQWFSVRAGFDAPQCLDESLTEEDDYLALLQLVEPYPPVRLTPVVEPIVLRLWTHVLDWKGTEPKTFGKLLLHGTFTALQNWNSYAYHFYLFERVLLGVKETPPLAPGESETLLLPFEEKPAPHKPEQPEIQRLMKLRGRIFFRDIIEIASSGSSTFSEYTLQISYLESPGRNKETFYIVFPDYTTMRLWQDTAERAWDQVMESTPQVAAEQVPSESPVRASTESIDMEGMEIESDTEFANSCRRRRWAIPVIQRRPPISGSLPPVPRMRPVSPVPLVPQIPLEWRVEETSRLSPSYL